MVTATFNSEKTIRDCVAAVNMQTHSDVEHVIVDGLSSDGTFGITKQLCKRRPVFSQAPPTGVYGALNHGIELASGDIVGLLHSDDVFASSDVLSKVASVFDDPNVVGCYGDLRYVKREDKSFVIRLWKAGPYDEENLRLGWMPPHPTLFVRKGLLESPAFDVSYQISADYDSILKVFGAYGLNIRYIPEVLVDMRMGGVSNRSLTNVIKKMREDLTIIKAHNIGGINTLTCKNLRKFPQLFAGRSWGKLK